MAGDDFIPAYFQIETPASRWMRAGIASPRSSSSRIALKWSSWYGANFERECRQTEVPCS